MNLELFAKPDFNISKKIRLIELFAGYGSQCMALERMGVDFESHYVCEFDKYAQSLYNAAHDTNFPTSDVTQIHAKDLNITETDKYTYLLTYSFPCFTADTLVLTDSGYKEIKDVVIGDYVLTHDNTFQKVIDSKKTKENADVISLKIGGTDGITCTPNHKFLVRTMKIKQTKRNGIRKSFRVLSDPEWKEAKDIKRWDFVGFPICQEEVNPKWDGYKYRLGHGEKNILSNELSLMIDNPDLWWLVGRYLADGWFLKDLTVVFSVRTQKLKEFLERVERLGFKYTIKEHERTAQKVYISKKELVLFLSNFGSGAYGKSIPGYVFKMPKNLIENLINGYESGDGWIDKRSNSHIASTVSRKLVYGLSQLIKKVYNRPVQISKFYRNQDVNIDGKERHIEGYIYTYEYTREPKKHQQAIVLDNQIWQPVKEIVNEQKKEDVYDITVENNHTFTANGVIVHNCQDLSLAGKQRGMEEGSGTRSSLLFEVKRLLSECDENLPQVLLMENVTQVHSKVNMQDFSSWIKFLTSLGYSSYYQDLNAKDFGIPQNRDRCFMVSLLGDYNFEFPNDIPLEYVWEDILEDNVDEKYFINNQKAEKLINQLIIEKRIPEYEE